MPARHGPLPPKSLVGRVEPGVNAAVVVEVMVHGHKLSTGPPPVTPAPQLQLQNPSLNQYTLPIIIGI